MSKWTGHSGEVNPRCCVKLIHGRWPGLAFSGSQISESPRENLTTEGTHQVVGFPQVWSSKVTDSRVLQFSIRKISQAP
jgi:hypothetical protein